MTHQAWLYFVLVSGVILMPGMDMAFVLGSALRGRRAGWAAVLGIMAGGVVHVLLGTLGVGLVLVAIPHVLQLLLVAGALYLGWIGWALLRGAAALAAVEQQPVRATGRTFAGGAATALLNPKAYLFMLAVFPQFVRPELGSLPRQALVLGGITSCVQCAVYGGVALAAERARSLLSGHPVAQVRLGRVVGVLLMVMALVALARSFH
jgi:threonine/homoserine/homoserine lactone efflux protein